MTGRATADPWSAVIVLTGATLASADLVSAAMWRFVRARPLVNRYKHNGAATVDLVRACCDFEKLPHDTASRARLAVVIVIAQVNHGALSREDRFARKGRLADVANRDPDLLPSLPPTAGVVHIYELLLAELNAAPGSGSPGHRSHD